MSTRWLFVLCLGIVSLGTIDCSKEDALKVVYEWKYIDYDFDSEEARNASIKSGEYNYTNAVPLDLDRWGNITFVTVIRTDGVPSSLNIVTNKTGPGGPLLKPYPDWSWAKLGDCSGITSVFRIKIDNCGKLWVIDSGIVNYIKKVCDPQILVFDIASSKLEKRVKIPKDIATNSTTGKGLLTTPEIIQNDYCQNTTVYIADSHGYALIVYNDTDGSFKRLTSSAYGYDPKATKFTDNSESFRLADGIYSLSHSSVTRRLYYTSLASYNLNVLQEDVRYRYNSSNLVYKDFFCTQTIDIVAAGSYIFFSTADNKILCYNEYLTLEQNHTDVVAENSETLQFVGGLKNVFDRNELWALSNKYENAKPGTFNFHEVNFRILKGGIDTLISGTRCERKSSWPCRFRFCGPGIVIFPPPLTSPSSISDEKCSPPS